jgi:hypothetical protein
VACHLGVPRQNDIWVLAPWPGTKNTIRGEGGGFPEVWVMLSFVSLCLLVVCPCTKCVLAMQPNIGSLEHLNYFIDWLRVIFPHIKLWNTKCFLQVRVNEWLLVILLSPILGFQLALLPPKCCELGSVPQLLTFLLFLLQTHIWIYQNIWEHAKLTKYATLIHFFTRSRATHPWKPKKMDKHEIKITQQSEMWNVKFKKLQTQVTNT